MREQHAAPIDVPPLTEAKLDGVLLSIGELNDIMGSSKMKVTSELKEMTDHSGEVSGPRLPRCDLRRGRAGVRGQRLDGDARPGGPRTR